MKKLSLIAIAALIGSSAWGLEFQTLGYKSISMGGAGVASSSGSLATYNNPALLAKPDSQGEFSIGVGASVHDHGVGDSFKKLDDSGFLTTIDKANTNVASLTTADKTNLIAGKDIILGMNGNSLEVSPQAELASKIGNIGFGVFVSSDVAATAVVDQTHSRLIFNNSGTYTELNNDGTTSLSNVSNYTNYSMEYAINNGLTYVEVKGIAIGEVPLAYGYDIHWNCGDLMIGGAVKYMYGYTYSQQYKIDNTGSTSSSTKQDKQTAAGGVDLGLAYQPMDVPGLTLGVVGKNLNTPEFKFVDGTKLKVDPMVRAGFAYDILDSLELAVDVDLTKNKTLVTGVDSQMVGGGLNWHSDTWFSMRVGAMQNLDSNDDAGVVYTAGLGLGPLDISGQMTTKQSAINGVTVPAYAKINVALVMRW